MDRGEREGGKEGGRERGRGAQEWQDGVEG